MFRFIGLLLSKILPEDNQPGAGYGPFKLDPSHPFNRGAAPHDYEFQQAHDGHQEKSKDQADFELFWRWAMIIRNSDTDQRIDLIWDLIKYWPVARIGGEALWDGD